MYITRCEVTLRQRRFMVPQPVRYIAIGGGMTLLGYVLTMIGVTYLSFPEALIVGVLNFIGVNIAGYLHLKFTFCVEQRMSRRQKIIGILQNYLVRVVTGVLICPLLINLFLEWGFSHTEAYWSAFSISGVLTFALLKIIYQA